MIDTVNIDFSVDTPLASSVSPLPAGEVVETLDFGLPDTHLVFSQPVKVEIPTPELNE